MHAPDGEAAGRCNSVAERPAQRLEGMRGRQQPAAAGVQAWSGAEDPHDVHQRDCKSRQTAVGQQLNLMVVTVGIADWLCSLASDWRAAPGLQKFRVTSHVRSFRFCPLHRPESNRPYPAQKSANAKEATSARTRSARLRAYLSCRALLTHLQPSTMAASTMSASLVQTPVSLQAIAPCLA